MSFNPEQHDLMRIRRAALDRYALHSVFHFRLSDPHDRRIAWAQSAALNINTIRAAGNDGAPPVAAGRLHAVTLLTEAYLRLMGSYADIVKSDFIPATIAGLIDKIGTDHYRQVCSVFLDEFPTHRLHRHVISAPDYLDCHEAVSENAAVSFQSMIVTWLHSMNPALKGYEDLFRMDDVAGRSPWTGWIEEVERQWRLFPPFGPGSDHLMELLLRPMRNAPHSIEDQLRYIASHWDRFLGDLFSLLLRGADMIREENRPAFGGPGPAVIPSYDVGYDEPEAYSEDVDWMPSVVLLAKNTYVWLEQLSREFGYSIERLDQVPEDALFQISRRGFSGLWLIGLWARSPASQRIKQMCGNPEAVASAYSVFDYKISDDLGGEDAFRVFKERASAVGIRLAGDMVPNHMGIDSWWVCRHPEWFISTDDSPFPHYSFTGADLSSDDRCSIRLEDHYYSRSDAAVVFKHVEKNSGRVRFIYHGNDGTGLPWNDTAQLDFLRDDVRKQVIQTIIDVAKRFPIIRFDAAMTLARKHFHRLWYPEPGEGGDIASRSRFGLTRREFDERMPDEFWREVVEQVAASVPDTLLLAEAFWLMEGYFVRTLGMHRVYNSAFMNMLSREDNRQYREVIKNTIEFDPEILKRYVNFMNNPDEDPAVVQFGKGDKYFGVCAMMSTLPGLPMFGHGQFEGYTEKYGMEYRRSYWNEIPDTGLMTHHERVITPLLKRRRLFSGADYFRLYDFYAPDQTVNENVFAYSNRCDDSRSLFIYNNSGHSAVGALSLSAAWRKKSGRSDGDLCRESLADALELSDHPDRFVLFYDVIHRKWWIRRNRSIIDDGLALSLGSYQCHAFINIHEVTDTPEKLYESVERHLQGKPVSDIQETWLDIQVRPYHDAFIRMTSEKVLAVLEKMTAETDPDTGENQLIDFDEFETVLTGSNPEFDSVFSGSDLRLTLDLFVKEILDALERYLIPVVEYRCTAPDPGRISIIWHGLMMIALNKIQMNDPHGTRADLRIWRLLERDLVARGMDERMADAAARLTDCLVGMAAEQTGFELYTILKLKDATAWIQVNRYRDAEFFNRESFEELLEWCRMWGLIDSEQQQTFLIEARRLGYRYKEFLDACFTSQ